MIGPYSANAKVNFMELFQSTLKNQLEKILPNPQEYSARIAGFGKITQIHRGAVAHINRLKVELDYLKMYFRYYEDREFKLPEEYWRVGDTITSRGGEKRFFHPKKRFLELWDVKNTPATK